MGYFIAYLDVRALFIIYVGVTTHVIACVGFFPFICGTVHRIFGFALRIEPYPAASRDTALSTHELVIIQYSACVMPHTHTTHTHHTHTPHTHNARTLPHTATQTLHSHTHAHTYAYTHRNISTPIGPLHCQSVDFTKSQQHTAPHVL